VPRARRILDPERTALIVVDVQEAFRPAVNEFDRVATNVATLIEGAKALGVPIVVTEQYPRGLGVTVPEVAEHLPEGNEAIEKVAFSAAQAQGFDLGGRDQALICGIESHVCVSQTAHDLLDRGVEVHVARDAVSSRTKENYELGLTKMEGSGAVMTSVEMALFELLGEAGSDQFKAVQRLVK
jgi:nicotinamidase-related amidase